MKVRYIILTVIFSCVLSVAMAQEITTIILVRHAEKALDEGDDPNLTKEGLKRSEELKRVLKDVEIDALFSTSFKRTRQTVVPLANARSLEIQSYDPFKLEEIVNLIDQYKGKTILFSGHSNTTPLILNKLVGDERYEQLDDADYDNLYIVTYLNPDQAKVVSLEFGADSEL